MCSSASFDRSSLFDLRNAAMDSEDIVTGKWVLQKRNVMDRYLAQKWADEIYQNDKSQSSVEALLIHHFRRVADIDGCDVCLCTGDD